MARKSITYGKYYVTRINGKPKVNWKEKGPDGVWRRPRFALKVPDNASDAEVRAALIAFVSRHEATLVREQAVTVDVILDLYADDRERDGKVAENIRYDNKQLKPFFGKMAPQDVSSNVCREYAKEEADKGRAASTILTRLSRLRSAFNWACKEQIIDKAPTMWFPQPSEARDRVLTDDEVVALLDEVSAPHLAHARLFVLLCLLTAGRTSAILELTWDRVDFDQGIINLKAPRQVDVLKKVVKKGRARVHMADSLRGELLAAKAKASSRYVVEYEGRPVKSLKTALGKAFRRAGIEGGSAHTLRHTAATWAEEGLVDDTHIQNMLGHKNVNTTRQNYMHGQARLTEGPVKAVEARLAPGARLKVVK